MSLKEEFDKIVYSEASSECLRGKRAPEASAGMKDRLDEVRPLLAEFADLVDDDYVRINISETRVVIDVGDRSADEERFEINGRWELEPNPDIRYLAEPGAEVLRPRSSFVVWKSLYLRPLMDFDSMSWDRLEFDTGVEAFRFVFEDVAKQIAAYLRTRSSADGAGVA